MHTPADWSGIGLQKVERQESDSSKNPPIFWGTPVPIFFDESDSEFKNLYSLVRGDNGHEIVVAGGDCWGYETWPECPTEVFNIREGEWRSGEN